MKILIVKDDKFETVGFYVKDETNNRDLFKWGVYPSKSFYYVKEMDVFKNREGDIMDLITLQSKVDAFSSIETDFFHCFKDEQIACLKKKELSSFNLHSLTDQRDGWREKIEKIVKSFV